MQDLTTKNFGLLIAYVLPGFTLLWGASHHSNTLQTWLGQTSAELPTVGGFLYVTLGSIAAGMTASTLRWLLIDTLHQWTGLQQPVWDFTQLAERVSAFDRLIEIHYHYYLWHGNMSIALVGAFVMRWTADGVHIGEAVMVIPLIGLFIVASRDALAKYQTRVAGVLGAGSLGVTQSVTSSGDQVSGSDA
ncbi:MAG: hypothetical protein KDA93_25775 [Planctomycetaceae bacterium]|nr:hypothetical protein [Planctomycetaceae bacterium]